MKKRIKLKTNHVITAALAAALFLCSVSGLSAQNRVSERENFHNTAYINTDDDEVKALLFQFGEALRLENYHEAVRHIMRGLRLERPSVVPFGERTFLSMREAALRYIAAMPEEALALYMEQAGSEVGSLLEDSPVPRDLGRLRRAITRYPLTKHAIGAMLALGDLAFERGENLRASRYYRQYLDESAMLEGTPYAAARATRARAGVSLYICLRLAGEDEEAARYRPDASLTLGGRTISAYELDGLLKEHAPDGTEHQAGWPTRGGHPSRARRPDFDCTALRLLWHYRLKEPIGEDGIGGDLDHPRQRNMKGKPPEETVYPIVHQGTLYLFDDKAFYPFDLETGNLRYGPIEWEWSLLFGGDAVRQEQLGNVTYSGAIGEGVLYATLNEKGWAPGRTVAHKGVLIAMDLAREGYFLWRRGGTDEEDPRLESVAFTGAPVVVEGRVFILGTRYTGIGEARADAVIFCFDAQTGRLLYDQFLCSGAEVDRFEIRLGLESRRSKDRVELGSPLAEHGGIIYALTNLGVAGAVDAFSGQILWLFKYNRIFSQDPDHYDRDFFLDTGGWKGGLPLVRDERLYLTPVDSRYAYCLALKPDKDGFIILDDPIEKGRMISLAGMGDQEFLFSARTAGRNKIIALDRNNAVLWETPPFEVEDRFVGRPLLTRTAVFLPTERHIYRLDLKKDGLITHAFPMPAAVRADPGQGGRFGNIIAIQDYLVSVSREDVIVFRGVSE